MPRITIVFLRQRLAQAQAHRVGCNAPHGAGTGIDGLVAHALLPFRTGLPLYRQNNLISVQHNNLVSVQQENLANTTQNNRATRKTDGHPLREACRIA